MTEDEERDAQHGNVKQAQEPATAGRGPEAKQVVWIVKQIVFKKKKK